MTLSFNNQSPLFLFNAEFMWDLKDIYGGLVRLTAELQLFYMFICEQVNLCGLTYI